MTNLNDLPTLAGYLFVDPDLSTSEARAMRASLSTETYRKRLSRRVFQS